MILLTNRFHRVRGYTPFGWTLPYILDLEAMRRHTPFLRPALDYGGWPQRFDPRRATELGFRAESTFDEIIRVHIEDELGGKIAA